MNSFKYFLAALLILIGLGLGCASSSQVQQTEVTAAAPKDIPDIHSAYAWFGSACSYLQTIINEDSSSYAYTDISKIIKEYNQSGLENIPQSNLPTGINRESLLELNQQTPTSNKTALIGITLTGLILVDAPDKAQELIDKCRHYSLDTYEIFNFVTSKTKVRIPKNLR